VNIQTTKRDAFEMPASCRRIHPEKEGEGLLALTVFIIATLAFFAVLTMAIALNNLISRINTGTPISRATENRRSGWDRRWKQVPIQRERRTRLRRRDDMAALHVVTLHQQNTLH